MSCAGVHPISLGRLQYREDATACLRSAVAVGHTDGCLGRPGALGPPTRFRETGMSSSVSL